MARRRNAGEDSIFRRADGRWCAQLDWVGKMVGESESTCMAPRHRKFKMNC